MEVETPDAITVQNLAGSVVASVGFPLPATLSLFKAAIEEQSGVPKAVQKLLHGMGVLQDVAGLAPGSLLTLVQDESLLATWDFDNNPDKDMLVVEGAHVHFTHARSDYCNVLTLEPLTTGQHFFEFVMHYIGDEQWCGVTNDPGIAGRRVSGHSSEFHRKGCYHYNHGALLLHDTQGDVRRVLCKKVLNGGVIGVLVDLDCRGLAFVVDGELQGTCHAPDGPLHILTHVDTREDHVELRKPPVVEAPADAVAALRQLGAKPAKVCEPSAAPADESVSD